MVGSSCWPDSHHLQSWYGDRQRWAPPSWGGLRVQFEDWPLNLKLNGGCSSETKILSHSPVLLRTGRHHGRSGLLLLEGLEDRKHCLLHGSSHHFTDHNDPFSVGYSKPLIQAWLPSRSQQFIKNCRFQRFSMWGDRARRHESPGFEAWTRSVAETNYFFILWPSQIWFFEEEYSSPVHHLLLSEFSLHRTQLSHRSVWSQHLPPPDHPQPLRLPGLSHSLLLHRWYQKKKHWHQMLRPFGHLQPSSLFYHQRWGLPHLYFPYR